MTKNHCTQYWGNPPTGRRRKAWNDLPATPHQTIGQSLAARTGLYVNHSLQGDNAAALSTLKLCWQAYCIRHMTDSEQLKPLYTGTTNRHLKGATLSQVLLPRPSDEERTEIVRRVEALFALADRIEARCTQAQRLTPLVLAKAFRGELVPQDPSDEPASELLVRIASANNAAT